MAAKDRGRGNLLATKSHKSNKRGWLQKSAKIILSLGDLCFLLRLPAFLSFVILVTFCG
jgi:hypothetical protein